MLSLNYENINYVMTQIIRLSCVSFSYVSISYVLAAMSHPISFQVSNQFPFRYEPSIHRCWGPSIKTSANFTWFLIPSPPSIFYYNPPTIFFKFLHLLPRKCWYVEWMVPCHVVSGLHLELLVAIIKTSLILQNFHTGYLIAICVK